MKYAHGERINIYWDSVCGDEPEYVKGHVTEDEARAVLNAWESGLGDGPMTLRHIYGRWVFPQSDEYDRELRTYAKPQRGAFKLTEIRPSAAPKPEVPRGCA